MTRFTVRPLLFVLAACLALFCQSAQAQITMTGDVPQKQLPVNPFPLPAYLDGNNDLLADTIDSQGNNVFFTEADLGDPNTWDLPEVWADYETPQNLLVGQTGSGTLEINNAFALRYQHLVLGGAGQGFLNPAAGFSTSDLDLSVGPGTEDFNFQIDLAAVNTLPMSGSGTVIVSGPGSVFNNDPHLVPGEFQNFIRGAVPGWKVDDGIPAGPYASPSTGISQRRELEPGNAPAEKGYDVHVGLLGSGNLDVNSGGRVEIQDALFVGLGESASGTVTVDGAGSFLGASGREKFDPSNARSTPTTVFGSIIGGHGTGSLNVTGGGRADFRNGLSLGHANSATALNSTAIPPASPDTGSGTVIIEGAGSTVSVFASRAINDVDGTTKIALAIGGMADDSAGANTGSGLLRIGDGGRVNVAFDSNYLGTVAADAKAIIGSAGKIEMQGGQLSVGDALVNDGDLRGHGTITSSTFYNGAISSLVVGEGERLSILSTGDASDTLHGYDATTAVIIHVDTDGNGEVDNGTNTSATAANAAVEDYYQANLGSIRVTGGELVLGRTVSTDPLLPLDRTEAFQNARYASVPAHGGPPPLVGETAIGTITSQDGTLNFKSGLYNTGVMAFTGGSSTVTGKVLNGGFDYDLVAGVLHELIIPGTILVSGDAASVTFENELDNQGTISLGPDNNVINVLGDFKNTGGTVKFNADSLDGAGIINVAGSMGLTNGNIVFAYSDLGDLTAGTEVVLLTSTGELTTLAGMSLTAPAPSVADPSLDWVLVPDWAGDRVLLQVVVSALGGWGPLPGDFNNDGTVDAADYTVWRDNDGTPADEFALNGNGTGDGAIDGGDYALWLMNFGSVASTALAVPEPSTALLALMASVAFVSRRR